MYYCAVRKYAVKHWLISIFWNKKIKKMADDGCLFFLLSRSQFTNTIFINGTVCLMAVVLWTSYRCIEGFFDGHGGLGPICDAICRVHGRCKVTV